MILPSSPAPGRPTAVLASNESIGGDVAMRGSVAAAGLAIVVGAIGSAAAVIEMGGIGKANQPQLACSATIDVPGCPTRLAAYQGTTPEQAPDCAAGLRGIRCDSLSDAPESRG